MAFLPGPSKALMSGVEAVIVSAAANGNTSNSASFMFSIPANPARLAQVMFQAVPSTGTRSDITTCKPKLQSLDSAGNWGKVTDFDLVAIPSQIIALIGGGVYSLTFEDNALVIANGTLNIEAKLG